VAPAPPVVREQDCAAVFRQRLRLRRLQTGTANWTSEFLSKHHQVDPHTRGAMEVAWFWGLLTIGCGLGLGLLKLVDSSKVLVGASGRQGRAHRGAFRQYGNGAVGLPRSRLVRLGDVAGPHVAGIELAVAFAWGLCRHSVHGNHRGRHGPALDRPDRRPFRAARRLAAVVCDIRLDSRSQLLGAAARPEPDDRSSKVRSMTGLFSCNRATRSDKAMAQRQAPTSLSNKAAKPPRHIHIELGGVSPCD